ncbi:FGGY family carbohydrate kinase [soil metagenome]
MTHPSTHYLSIDIGTESARAAVFTADGARVGDGHGTYPTVFPQPGWAEQDPELWWRGAVDAAREALASAGVDRVAGVSVATTSSSVVVLDEQGKPLRPALLWMDSRAWREAEITATVAHPVLALSGGSDSSEWLVPKAMWLARSEPEIYARARFIGESVDYLTYRLTGQWIGSQMTATCKWNYDSRIGSLPTDLYEELGVPDLADKLARDIRPVGAPAGEMSVAAAAKLGLVNRPIVGVGGIDAHLSLIPLQAGGRRPVSIVAGTSNAFIAEMDEAVFSPTIWGPYPNALTEGLWLVEGGQVSAGSSLTWLAERMLGYGRERVHALVADAALVGPLDHGLLMLSNFMGNRTPLRDPRLRGGVLGLQLGTTPAQLYRAAVESVAFGTRQVLESFAAVGVNTDDVVLSGGIRHNPLWMRLTADVLGRPVTIAEGENLTLLACAAISAAAVNGTTPLIEAEAFAPVTRRIDPTDESALYDETFAIYCDAVTATSEIGYRLQELDNATARAKIRAKAVLA